MPKYKLKTGDKVVVISGDDGFRERHESHFETIFFVEQIQFRLHPFDGVSTSSSKGHP